MLTMPGMKWVRYGRRYSSKWENKTALIWPQAGPDSKVDTSSLVRNGCTSCRSAPMQYLIMKV